VIQFEGGGKLSPTGLKETMPDVSFGTLAYHVRQLAGAGLLKPAGQVPRRGAVEHLYMLTTKGATTAALLSELVARL
jgi:DNA-binding HxlR family transcriptional regulator